MQNVSENINKLCDNKYYLSIAGFSARNGAETPCEVAKKRIEEKIMGISYPEESMEFDKENENDQRCFEQQRQLLSEYENDDDTTLGAWLKEITDECKLIVQEDDGDRDNIMLNKEFSEHFLRLCNLLPLWCSISCKVFGSPTITSSSANVESYFKDVKLVHKKIIPANADVFLQNHMDSINDSIITASQKYATLVDVNVVGIRSDLAPTAQQNESITNADDSVIESLHRLSFEENEHENDSVSAKKQCDTSECIACSQGNLPTGGHTCIKCNKFVHTLAGCSVAIDDNEGYGTKRICLSCHLKKRQTTQLRATAEMNVLEKWGGKQKIKQSVYLLPNPAFKLMSNIRKSKIGLLRNCSLSTTFKRIEGVEMHFSDSCATDSCAQSLAGAYAYYPDYRNSLSESDKADPLMEIAIQLTIRYVKNQII